MPQVSNSPRQVTILRLEARKSFSLGLLFQFSTELPMNLTGCALHMTVKQQRRYGSATVISATADLVDAENGEARFNLQAADLDLDNPREYDFSVVMLSSEGYSGVILKGVLDLQENTSSEFLLEEYDGVNPPENLTVVWLDNNDVVVRINHLPPPRIQIGTVTTVAFGEPAEAELTNTYPIQTLNLTLPEGPPGAGFAGGITGQFTRKASDDDYDLIWHTLVKGDVGLGNVDNTSDLTKPVSAAQQAAIDAAIAALVDTAPATLDTLNELAAALGDDPNFATTVLNQLAGKIDKTTLDANSVLIANADDTPISKTVAASTFFGRKAVGDIDDMTAAEAWELLRSGAGRPVEIGVALSDEATALTAGTSKVTIRVPYGMVLTGVRTNLNTASSVGDVVVDVNKNGGTVLSTKVTIEVFEKTSLGAAAQPVIIGGSATWLSDDEITFDIDSAGTGAKGLKIWLLGVTT